jgi:hypothetical protein
MNHLRDGRDRRSSRRRDRKAPPLESIRERRRTAAPKATYRRLGSLGLSRVEAGNLTAFMSGLRPSRSGWTIEQIDRLLFLRYLVATGRIRPDRSTQ